MQPTSNISGSLWWFRNSLRNGLGFSRLFGFRPDLTRTDGKRPDGKSLIPWSNGKPLVWDVTVTDTLANTYVYASSQNAGAAAAAAETRKQTKYSHLSTNYNFTPIALETFGT